jgi:hypothetical protein
LSSPARQLNQLSTGYLNRSPRRSSKAAEGGRQPADHPHGGTRISHQRDPVKAAWEELERAVHRDHGRKGCFVAPLKPADLSDKRDEMAREN